MTSTLLNMQDPISSNVSRKTPIGGFSSLGSVLGPKSNNISTMSTSPWGSSIWGSNHLSLPSTKHLQVDTSTATKFQKTGSGLLVESSTTDDWSAGIKNFDTAENISRPQTRYSDTMQKAGSKASGSEAPLELSMPSGGRGSAMNSGNADDTPRPTYTSSFTNLPALRSTVARPSSSSSYNKTTVGSEASSWAGDHYSHSPTEDQPYLSHSSANSIPSSVPTSHHSDDAGFDAFQHSRISPDTGRILGARHNNLSNDQQLAMQLGQLGLVPGLDTSFQNAMSKSPNAYPGGPLSGASNLTRFNTFPETQPNSGYESDLMSGQTQPFSPFGSSFYPGMASHQSVGEFGFSEMYDTRPASSSSSIGRDSRRDSAHSRELQMYCNPRSAGSEYQHSARLRQQSQLQQQGYRQMAPADMRGVPYYSPMLMHRMPGSAFPMTPGSYHPALAGFGHMPPSALMSPGYAPDMPAHFDQAQACRSPLLQDYRQRTDKKLTLKDIYGHVVEFSGDQHGSRFIQSKLETGASSEEKDRIFQEIEPNALQLMTDVFGNYVIQKLFEHGDQTQKKLLANKMKGRVYDLSTQMYGCRVVQKALQHILNDQQATIIRELDQAGDIVRCVKDQNGNHVIQRAIERCEPTTTKFILAAFTGQIMHLSNHAYGCRVIQRCLESCSPQDKAAIMIELHEGMASLVSDQYGNYVVQHVVEHGSDQDRASVLEIVKNDLGNYSKHKFASNVVEKCLESANETWRAEVIQKLIEVNRVGADTMLLDLIKDSYGNYVIQKLLDVMSHQDYAVLLERLVPELNKAKRANQGKQVQSIEKKMSRFDPSISSSDDSTYSSNCNTPPTMAPAMQNYQNGYNMPR